jgi:hypothetical protein
MSWINLAQDRDQWWALVNMEMNRQAPFYILVFMYEREYRQTNL